MYIVIAGAGLVGRGLAERLMANRHDVVMIEQDKAVCDTLVSTIGVLTFAGSATDVDVLEQAGIQKADVAVATMRADADNLAFSLLAKSFDVPRVIARLRNRRYEGAYRQAGVTTTVQIAEVFASQILLEIEEPHLRQVATFGGGSASIVVDTVPAGAAAAGQSVSEIAASDDFPTECVISGIFRPSNQQFIFPRGSAQVQEGDRVFLVAAQSDLRRASRFLHRRASTK